MKCVNCYQEIPDGSKFCQNCGAKQPETEQQTSSSESQPTTEEGDFILSGQECQDPGNQDPGYQDPGYQGQTYQDLGNQDPGYQSQMFQDPQGNQGTGYQDPGYQGQTYQDPGYEGQRYQDPGNQSQGYQGQTYQDPGNQGTGYQNPGNQGQGYQDPGYDGTGEQQPAINWVPYMILSVISTLCCCMPLGIVGIVYASRINNAMLQGNLKEAKEAEGKAKLWIILAFVLGFFANLIVLSAQVLFGVIQSSEMYY